MFKKIRIVILLLILTIVGGRTFFSRVWSTDWDIPLGVIVYPVNGDGSAAAARYISSLERDTFEPVADYFVKQAKQHDLPLSEPITIDLTEEVSSLPPQAPFGGSRLAIMLWSLKMRWWAWRVDKYDGPGNIKAFVLYFDTDAHKELDHSLGLEKGMVCMVNAFASRNLAARNNVIIAHELLHTLGATDKYDPQTSQPIFPEGYANPERQPRYPQQKAEIMGGLIPVSETTSDWPQMLRDTVIGPVSAREIGWITMSDD
ncbi:MAG: hypothetical protein KKE17_06495 [Proteobacteria bacterium]|nr:hypothetical protein [Pseudomonadota bacterium]MBU1709637.1 hypothetical protein [Pseudomonadota bacterium]